MPSASLGLWQTTRAATLDEIEAAHVALGGLGRGRRYATQQVNHAYVVLLSGQFQGFCRDLHTESARFLVNAISPVVLQAIVEDELLRDRKIDRGNPSPGNIGADFSRINVEIWAEVYHLDRRNRQRRAALDALNEWRNAIAHQDFLRVGSDRVQLREVRRWRTMLESLATSFDTVVYSSLKSLVGRDPW